MGTEKEQVQDAVLTTVTTPFYHEHFKIIKHIILLTCELLVYACVCVCVYMCTVLKVEPRASSTLGKFYTTELHQ